MELQRKVLFDTISLMTHLPENQVFCRSLLHLAPKEKRLSLAPQFSSRTCLALISYFNGEISLSDSEQTAKFEDTLEYG